MRQWDSLADLAVMGQSLARDHHAIDGMDIGLLAKVEQEMVHSPISQHGCNL